MGYPYRFVLTPGQASDIPQAKPLLAGISFTFGIGDKGYDADWIVAMIEAQGGVAVIPSKCNRKVQRPIDWYLYKERNIVERCFNRLKQFRRVATRFEKTARNYLAMLTVASITLWLR